MGQNSWYPYYIKTKTKTAIQAWDKKTSESNAHAMKTNLKVLSMFQPIHNCFEKKIAKWIKYKFESKAKQTSIILL